MTIEGFRPKREQNLNRETKRPLASIEKSRREIEHITDGLGLPIDEGIREAVAVLRALDIETTQSCEGHRDRGSPSPFIDVEVRGKPVYRFHGEQEAREAIAMKYDIAPKEIDSWPLEEDRQLRAEQAYEEWGRWITAHATEETPKYKAWYKADRDSQRTVRKLTAEFYSTRAKPAEGYVRLEHGRLHVANSLYKKFQTSVLNGRGRGLSAEDLERLHQQLPVAQAEMQAFIDFLKQKFFDQSPVF